MVFIHDMLDGIGVTRRIGDALGAHGFQLMAPIRTVRPFGAMAPRQIAVAHTARFAPALLLYSTSRRVLALVAGFIDAQG